MRNIILEMGLLFFVLALTGFLIAASYYAKHKQDTSFGKFSKEFDEVLKGIITEIINLFSKDKK